MFQNNCILHDHQQSECVSHHNQLFEEFQTPQSQIEKFKFTLKPIQTVGSLSQIEKQLDTDQILEQNPPLKNNISEEPSTKAPETRRTSKRVSLWRQENQNNEAMKLMNSFDQSQKVLFMKTQSLNSILFAPQYIQKIGNQQLDEFYTQNDSQKILSFLQDFLDTDIKRTENEFQNQLEELYNLARIRYTKGGHKTNQDRKIRKSFICQCHGRGSGYERSDQFRKRDHFFSQSQCKSRISIRQFEAGKDLWVLDKSEFQHNHPPQSLDFFLSQQTKNIDLEQKIFITECYLQNPKINGAEIRKRYKENHPNIQNMFGKKVQNMLQILRKGKDIVKDQSELKRIKTSEIKGAYFNSTNTSSNQSQYSITENIKQQKVECPAVVADPKNELQQQKVQILSQQNKEKLERSSQANQSDNCPEDSCKISNQKVRQQSDFNSDLKNRKSNFTDKLESITQIKNQINQQQNIGSQPVITSELNLINILNRFLKKRESKDYFKSMTPSVANSPLQTYNMPDRYPSMRSPSLMLFKQNTSPLQQHPSICIRSPLLKLTNNNYSCSAVKHQTTAENTNNFSLENLKAFQELAKKQIQNSHEQINEIIKQKQESTKYASQEEKMESLQSNQDELLNIIRLQQSQIISLIKLK